MSAKVTDLVSIGEAARRLGEKPGTVRMWAYRGASTHFPAPVLEMSGRKLYSWSQIERWYAEYRAHRATL
jgi:hypothetical protein